MKPALKTAIGVGLGLAVVGGAAWYFTRKKPVMPAITTGGGGGSNAAAIAQQYDQYFIYADEYPGTFYFLSGGQKHLATASTMKMYMDNGFTGQIRVEKATMDSIPTGSVLS